MTKVAEPQVAPVLARILPTGGVKSGRTEKTTAHGLARRRVR